MESALLVFHYLLCFFLIIVILLQAGKGADIGAVFGGASQTVFGSRGPATFLSKMTAVCAILFLCTSIWLANISKNRSADTVIDKATTTQTVPAGTDAAKEEQQVTGAPATPDAEKTAPAEKSAPVKK